MSGHEQQNQDNGANQGNDDIGKEISKERGRGRTWFVIRDIVVTLIGLLI